MQRFAEQAEFSGAKIIAIDGLRVEFSMGWGLLRASNTSPCLSARFEAVDLASLEQIKQLFKKEIQRVSPDLKLPF